MMRKMMCVLVAGLGLVQAQPQVQGPLVARFPYVPAERVEPVFDLGAMLGELQPTLFEPVNYTLPDEILFSAEEQRWVNQLREAFTKVNAGEFEAAGMLFQEFLAVYPEHLPSRVALADIRYTTGQYAEAEALYRALLEEEPNHFQALNNLAWMYSTSPDAAFRNPEEARELVRRAMLVAPQSHHVWSTLSQTLYAQGRFQEAAEASATSVNLAQRSRAPAEVLVGYLLQLDRCRAALQATQLMD